ncbi:MAG: hypothetical protein KBD00_02620 [Candidatus Peribacteraceae bacterium]|nr:hypothetical protein [Candidatus Peribacteraceae bacterium]
MPPATLATVLSSVSVTSVISLAVVCTSFLVWILTPCSPPLSASASKSAAMTMDCLVHAATVSGFMNLMVVLPI